MAKKKKSPKRKSSPKSGKSRKSPREKITDDSWRNELIETDINNINAENIHENWSMIVALINPANNNLEVEYLKHFEKQAIDGNRSVIKCVSYEETMFMISQIGSESYNCSGEICYPQIFKEAKKILADEKLSSEIISSETMGMLIKSQLLTLKQTDLKIQRQKKEVEDGLKRESEAIVLESGKKKGKKSPRQKSPGKKSPKAKKKASPKKGKNKKKDGIKKFATTLRVRGEEWRDKVYIDDHAVQGPNLYVALINFLDPVLPRILLDLKVPLLGVVRLRLYPNIESSYSLTSHRIPGQQVDEEYWSMIEKYRFNTETANFYKTLSFFSFFPPYKPTDIELGILDDSQNIYHDISFLLYDFNDLQRQHSNYLSNMDISTVASPRNEMIDYEKYSDRLPPSECFNEIFILNCLINAISHDYENQRLIRKSVSDKLSKIEIEQNVNLPKLFSKSKSKEGLDQFIISSSEDDRCPSVQILEDSEIKLTKFEDDYKCLKDLIVINNGDLCKRLAFHLDDSSNTDMKHIVINILENMPFAKHFTNPQIEDDNPKHNYYYCYLTLLENYFTKNGVNATDTRQLISLLICQKLYDSYPLINLVPPTLMNEYKIRYLKRTVSTKLLKKKSISKTSFHYCQCDHEIDPIDESLCPDICENLVKQHCGTMKYYNRTDYMNYSCLLQKMYLALNSFNSMKYKYNKITDSIYIMFSNRYDYDRIFTNEWHKHIPTPVCLQDFFDYILDENYEWIKNQEDIYDNKMAMEYEQRHRKLDSNASILPPRFCLDAENIDKDLLIDGSLKFDLWVKSMTTDKDSKKKKSKKKKGNKKSSSKKGSPKERSPRKKSPKTKSSKIKSPKSPKKKKKSPAKIQVLPESEKKTAELDEPENISQTEMKVKHFLGYNLSDRRIQILGKDMTYFSKDGCKICSTYTMHTYPSYMEEFGLKICINKHCISMFREKSSSLLRKNTSILITTENGVLISFKEYVGMEVNAEKSYSSINPISKKLSEHPSNVIRSMQPSDDIDNMKSTSRQQYTESKSHGSAISNKFQSTEESKSLLSHTFNYFLLTISWPSGLIIETVFDFLSSFPVYIKQKYLSKGPECCSITNEMFRCMSLNGEVLIFHLDGLIQILRPNNIYIKYVDDKFLSTEQVTSTFDDDKSSTLLDHTSISQKSVIIENILYQDPEIKEDLKDEELIDEEMNHKDAENTKANAIQQRTSEEMYKEKLLSESEILCQYGEMYTRTPDGINSLLNKDGVLTVSFPDGTQITSYFVVEDLEIYPEWTSEELLKYFSNNSSGLTESKNSINLSSATIGNTTHKNYSFVSVNIVYTMEHPNYSTIISDRSKNTLCMKMPDDSKIIINADGSYIIQLDEISNVNLNKEKLNVSYEACHCGPYFSKIDVNLNCLRETNLPECTEWASMADSCGKTVSVNVEGLIQVNSADKDFIPEEVIGEPSTESCNIGAGDSAFKTEENEVNKQSHLLSSIEQNIDLKSSDFIRKQHNINQRHSDDKVYSNGRHEDCICNAPKLHVDKRFFVINRNNTGEELVHDDFVEKYIKDSNELPFGYVYENTCPCEARPEKTTKVILNPVVQNQSQKWLMKPLYPSKPSTYTDSTPGDDIHRLMSTEKLPKVFTIRTLEPILAKDIQFDLEELKASLLSFHDAMSSSEANVDPCHSCLCLSEQDKLLEERRNAMRRRAIDELSWKLEKMRREPTKEHFKPPCGRDDSSEKCMQLKSTPSEEQTETQEEEMECSACLKSSSSSSSTLPTEAKGLQISDECKILLSDISDTCVCEEMECYCEASLNERAIDELNSELNKKKNEPERDNFKPPYGREESCEKCMQLKSTPPEEQKETQEEEMECSACLKNSLSSSSTLPTEAKGLEMPDECNLILSENISEQKECCCKCSLNEC